MVYKAEEDYIKFIYEHKLSTKETVTVKDIAEYFSYSEQSVYEMIKKLQTKKYIKYKPYEGVTLLEKGYLEAVRMIRNHRIWEVFLGRYLGYSWDEVHEEAEKLEHAGSEKMLRKLYELLDRPETCQHGNAIPTFTKPFTDKLYNSLNKYDIGDIVVVRQVKDDTELLKYLTKINLKLSDSIEIINKYDVLKQIEIKVHNQNIMMSDFTAKFIYVEKIF